MLANVAVGVNQEFMELGKGILNVQCHQGLQLFSAKENNYTQVMTEFMSLKIGSEPLLDTIKNYRPQLIWVQMVGKCKLFSDCL